nr:hypothetical protein [Tanacetum cinerariifolium]
MCNTVGICGELDAFVSIPNEGDMTFLRKKVKSGAAVGKLVLLQARFFNNLSFLSISRSCLDASHSSDDLSTSGLHHFTSNKQGVCGALDGVVTPPDE